MPCPSPQPLPLAGITELLGLSWNGPDIDYGSPWTWLVVAGLNVVSIGLTLVIARAVLAALPVDYFTVDPSAPTRGRLRAVRTAAGLAVMFLGLIFLVTPGQGTVMILVGLMMTDLPGKHRLERRLARSERVMKALNWLRAKSGQPPLERPQATAETAVETDGETGGGELGSRDRDDS